MGNDAAGQSILILYIIFQSGNRLFCSSNYRVYGYVFGYSWINISSVYRIMCIILEGSVFKYVCLNNMLTIAALYSKLSWKLFIGLRCSKVHYNSINVSITMHPRITNSNT